MAETQLGSKNRLMILQLLISFLIRIVFIALTFNSSTVYSQSSAYFEFKDKFIAGPNRQTEDPKMTDWLKEPKSRNASDSSGGSDAGGGMGLKKELVDFAEARNGSGRVSFNTSELRILQTSLNEILEKSLAKAPDFRKFILSLLKQSRRNWFFVNGSLDSYLDTSNLHLLLNDKKSGEVIAVQNSTTVLIKIPWLLESTELEQIGLFVHEALMSVALDYKLPHDHVRELNRVIFAEMLGGGFPNNFELLLNQLGYLVPLQDYLKRSGEYGLIYSIQSASQFQELVDLEEAGGAEFLRVEPMPEGQSKLVYRRLPGGIRPNRGVLVLNNSSSSADNLKLIWSGVLTSESFSPLNTYHIYRLR